MVEHRSPKPAVGGSIPSARAERHVSARVAQPVEHFLGKEEVSGSSPDASSEGRIRDRDRDRGRDQNGGWQVAPEGVGNGPHRLTVRTPLFQGGDRGSIPRGGVVQGAKRRDLKCFPATSLRGSGMSGLSVRVAKLPPATSLRGVRLDVSECGRSSVGRASACHAEGRRFESGRPL